MTNNFKKIPISDRLDDKVNESLKIIDHQAIKNNIRKVFLGCSVTAAVFAGTFILASTNPVLAKKIPVLGRIFSNVEKDITFSGNYSEEAEVLTNTNSDTENLSYSVKDNGVTITASEVYCDGYSVYLTLNVDSKKPLGEISSYFTSSNGDTTSQFLYTEGTFRIGESGTEIKMLNNHIQGKQISQNSFAGMIKLDLKNLSDPKNFVNLHLNINKIGADTRESMMNQTVTSIQPVMTEGLWEFKIPVSINKKNVKNYQIADRNEKGYGIHEVVVTPYQILVETIAPVVFPYADLTEKEFNELYGEKNKQLIEDGKEPVKYQDIVSRQTQEEYGVAVFDQNGDKIEFQQQDGTINTFSIKGRDIQKVYIYIGTDFIGTVKETNQQKMIENVVYKTELDLKK